MIRSMTGFGRAQIDTAQISVSISIRTLNSKQLDLNIKMPQRYRDHEGDIRSLIAEKLNRGKVDVMINLAESGGNTPFVLNQDLAKEYYSELTKLQKELEVDAPKDWMSILLKLPDVIKASNEEVKEEEWNLVFSGMLQAVDQTNAFRCDEGKALAMDMLKRIQLIREKAISCEKYEVERIKLIREKIIHELEALPQKQNYNPARFEEEMIYYLEKIDITEEKVRLAKHLQYFEDTLQDEKGDANGKKLGFITQEIGREINTLGNKASQIDMQKLVVEMKDELEKIKEQVLNIL